MVKTVYQLPGAGRVFIAPDAESLALSIAEAQLPEGSFEVASEADLILPPPTENAPA
jgi:hypothetical protein